MCQNIISTRFYVYISKDEENEDYNFETWLELKGPVFRTDLGPELDWTRTD